MADKQKCKILSLEEQVSKYFDKEKKKTSDILFIYY